MTPCASRNALVLVLVASRADALVPQPAQRRLCRLPRVVNPRTSPSPSPHNCNHLTPTTTFTLPRVSGASREFDDPSATSYTTRTTTNDGELLKDGIGLRTALILLNVITLLWGTQVWLGGEDKLVYTYRQTNEPNQTKPNQTKPK